MSWISFTCIPTDTNSTRTAWTPGWKSNTPAHSARGTSPPPNPGTPPPPPRWWQRPRQTTDRDSDGQAATLSPRRSLYPFTPLHPPATRPVGLTPLSHSSTRWESWLAPPPLPRWPLALRRREKVPLQIQRLSNKLPCLFSIVFLCLA